MLFSYKAIDRNGQMVSGTYEASERSQVVTYIKAQHMTPVEIGAGKANTLSAILPKKKTAAKDLSMFCEQFCALLRAGVTIVDGLKLLLEQTKDKALREAIQSTIVGVNEGETLANSMARDSVCFDDTLINLIRAGEASGSLDVSLERMSEQYKKDAEISAAIKKAMSYPIIVFVVAIVVVIIMLVFVVPNFMAMFMDVGIEMPKITLMVMSASEWMVDNWLLLVAILIGVVFAAIAFAKSAFGKKCFSKMALVVPGINNFTVKSNASKIARTLSTLLTSGMTVIESLKILESTLSNYYYKEAINSVREDVLTGQPMSRRFISNTKLFPSMLSHMIAVGEDTGDITSMLVRTADYYDLEVQTATDTMMSMMQPAVIVLLTGVVGVLIAAVFAPMLALYSQLGDSL